MLGPWPLISDNSNCNNKVFLIKHNVQGHTHSKKKAEARQKAEAACFCHSFAPFRPLLMYDLEKNQTEIKGPCLAHPPGLVQSL